MVSTQGQVRGVRGREKRKGGAFTPKISFVQPYASDFWWVCKETCTEEDEKDWSIISINGMSVRCYLLEFWYDRKFLLRN